LSALPKPNPFANRVGIGKPYNLQMKTALPMAQSLPIKSKAILLVTGRIRFSLITKETFENVPPPMSFIVKEGFENNPPPMSFIVKEGFENNPPPMSAVTTEDFDGYSVGQNIEHTPIGLTSQELEGLTVTIEQNIDGLGTFRTIDTVPFGLVTSPLLYPGREHRSTAPATVGSKNISPPGSNIVTYTPSYTVKQEFFFTYV